MGSVMKSSLVTRARASGPGSHGGTRDSPEFVGDLDVAALPSERGDREKPPLPKRAKSSNVKTPPSDEPEQSDSQLLTFSCSYQKPPVQSSLVSGTRVSG